MITMLRKPHILIVLAALFVLCTHDAYGAKRYWRGTASTSWKNKNNWAATSGGTVGVSVPGSSDTAYFDSGGNNNCGIDSAVNVRRMEVVSSYTRTITQNNNAITIGAGNAYFGGGTFIGSGSSVAITINGSLTLDGTAFTCTAGTMTCNGGFSLNSGSFTHNSGIVSFTTTATVKGTITFSTLEFAPGAANAVFTITNTITAAVLLKVGGTRTVTLDNGTINASKDITISNNATGGGGTATIDINGSSGTKQTINGAAATLIGALPHVTITKTAADTLFMSGITSINGNWTFTSGTVVPQVSSGLCCIGNFNLDMENAGVTMSVYNLALSSSGTRTLTGNAVVTNNFSINTGTTLAGSSYTLSIYGVWSANGSFTAGTSTVEFLGSNYKDIRRGSGSETFYNLRINKPGSAVKATCPVIVSNVLTLSAGRLRTNTTNYVSLVAGASVSGGSGTAFVDGPLRKTGSTAFTFTVGDSAAGAAAYHPLTMTAPSSATDQFQVQYMASAQGYGTARAGTLNTISTCEYWTLNRLAGTSTPSVSLGWNSNCDNGGYAEMRVGLWNGTQWTDLGQSSSTVSGAGNGTLVSTTATSYTVNPAPVTICYATVSKSYATMGRTPGAGFHTTDGNVLYFSFEDEYKDANGLLSYSIVSLGNDRPVTLIANGLNNAAVAYGQNRYRIDLYDNTNTPLASGYYMLEVTNDKKETWYLRFKI